MKKHGLFDEIMPVSKTPTSAHKTGLWGNLKPLYKEATSPCRESCPLNTDIPLFIFHMKEKDLKRAKEEILLENPFPGISGRVCHHPCEDACNRRELDSSVSVRALERFLGDYPFYEVPVSENRSPKKVAIVGSGPAGLSCAYFLLRLGHKVTIFEKESDVGGLLLFGIPPYRLPKNVLRRDLHVLLALKPQIRLNFELTGDNIFSLLGSFDYVFLAPGMGESKRLQVAGENKKGVYYGVQFLKEVKSIEDEIRRAIVIGGGDVAMDVARTIRRLKPDAKVSIFAPEKVEDLPALRENVAEALEEGIDLICGYLPLYFEGKKRIEAVIFQRTEVKKDEKTGKFLFIPLNEKREEAADMAVVCIGQKPLEASKLREIAEEEGYILVDHRGRTKIERIYAGGDIIGQKATVSLASSSGKRAAICIDMDAKRLDLPLDELYVGSKGFLSFKKYLKLEKKETRKVVGFSDLNTLPHEKIPRVDAKKEEPLERLKDFREIGYTYTKEEAEKESDRCLSCGQCMRCNLCFYLCPDVSIRRKADGLYEVDEDYCKSCGVCAKTCPSNVIEMVEKDGGAFIR